MRPIVSIVLLIFCVCAYVPAAFAQEGAAKPAGPDASANRGPDDRNAREMVEIILAAKLAKELGLNDEQTVLMLRRVSEFRGQIAALRKDRQAKQKALKTSVQAGEPDDQIQAKLNDLVEQDVKLAEFRKTAYESACEGLSVPQRAKLYVFLNEFESDMRRLVQQARERNAHRLGHGAEQRDADTADHPARPVMRLPRLQREHAPAAPPTTP
jgi:hypothetical protein